MLRRQPALVSSGEGECNPARVWLGEHSIWRKGLVMSVPDDGWDRCRFYGTETRSLMDDPGGCNSWDVACHARVQQKYFKSHLIRISQADLKLQPVQFIS